MHRSFFWFCHVQAQIIMQKICILPLAFPMFDIFKGSLVEHHTWDNGSV